MEKTISETTRRRLNAQGLCDVDDKTLAEIAPWHRLAFALCAIFAATGTILAWPLFLWILSIVAILAVIFPVHPFDLIYNHGIRYLRNTGPLPIRRAQTRFACGVGAVWLIATGLAFYFGATNLGYILGFALVSLAVLVSTTDICIASIIYNALFSRSQTN